MDRWVSIAAAIVVLTALVVLLTIGPQAGNVDHLRRTMLAYGPWAAVISSGLMIAQAIIAPLPMNVITITNALVFGPVWGGVLSWLSMVVGACLCFLLSKTFGKPLAQKVIGGSIERGERFFRKYGLHAIFLVRIMPFVPFDAVSYGAPLVGVPFSRFLLATAVGIVPSILVYSYLSTLIAQIYWWVVVGILAATLIAVLVAVRWRRMLRIPSRPFAS